MPEWTLKDARSTGLVLHPSTQCVLEAMRELAALQPERVLDIGCGSGLLTLAAGELWPKAQVLAADIHPQAVADTQANVAAQGRSGRVRVVRAEGFSHPLIRQGGPYGLILCNLLAEIVVRLAPEVKAYLAPGGAAVLSGILPWQVVGVREAYAALGFEMLGEIEAAGWVALICGCTNK